MAPGHGKFCFKAAFVFDVAASGVAETRIRLEGAPTQTFCLESALKRFIIYADEESWLIRQLRLSYSGVLNKFGLIVGNFL